MQVFQRTQIPVSLRDRVSIYDDSTVVWGDYLTLPDPDDIEGVQRIEKIEKIPMVRSTNDFVRKVYL